MDHFIERENIKRFKAQLKDCADQRQKETLQRLLTEEEAKLRRWEPTLF